MSMTNEKAREIDGLFHKLWTKAVGTKDYDKKEWKLLEDHLYRLYKITGVEPGWGLRNQ